MYLTLGNSEGPVLGPVPILGPVLILGPWDRSGPDQLQTLELGNYTYSSGLQVMGNPSPNPSQRNLFDQIDHPILQLHENFAYFPVRCP